VKLATALKIAHSAPPDAPPFRVLIACGFTPLHVKAFLTAHLQEALPLRHVEAHTGLYGDVMGTLARMSDPGLHAAAVFIEWSDLDARLGYRGLGGWGPSEVADVVARFPSVLNNILACLRGVPNGLRVVISLPTLPLAPVFSAPGWLASKAQLDLQGALSAFASDAASLPNIAFVNPGRLAELSPVATRFNLDGEINSGLPYSIAHADTLSLLLARIIQPATPKKGLITDLDDTLWRGLVGEVGAEGISWDLASHSHFHGLYQQMLRSLADQGVLLAAASKNSRTVVEQAFARPDILLPQHKIFPLEIHWEAKSASVARILNTWNIAPDSVVFVDDSSMELEEVRAAYPEIECILFPGKDARAFAAFLEALRDRFGKETVSHEDTLRLDSIRNSAVIRQALESGGAPDNFLAHIEAVITVDLHPPATDARILELVNKTNQFNLNGIRHTQAEWNRGLECPGAFLLSVAYRDKFGPLGTIAVLKGLKIGNSAKIDAWVMSCRAFTRRIEFRCLEILFEKLGAEEVLLEFAFTPKNGPTQDFLAAFLGTAPESSCRIPKHLFYEKRPPLHQIVEYLNE
jgi:FkbH-like protein